MTWDLAIEFHLNPCRWFWQLKYERMPWDSRRIFFFQFGPIGGHIGHWLSLEGQIAKRKKQEELNESRIS